MDLLPKIRLMAQNHAGGNHPWTTMDDMELLKSAGLYGRDIVTGDEGFNLAAIMLLGKDDVILNVAQAYVTDALVRKVNLDNTHLNAAGYTAQAYGVYELGIQLGYWN